MFIYLSMWSSGLSICSALIYNEVSAYSKLTKIFVGWLNKCFIEFIFSNVNLKAKVTYKVLVADSKTPCGVLRENSNCVLLTMLWRTDFSLTEKI